MVGAADVADWGEVGGGQYDKLNGTVLLVSGSSQ